MDGLTNGMLKQILENQISSSVSHMQVHKAGYNDEKVVQNFIPDPSRVESALRANPKVLHYSKRIKTFGLLSSASNSSGVYINGIDPESEQKISSIRSYVDEGTYLSGGMHEIVMGKKLADKLKVELGDKVVAMSNTPDGTIGSDVFRIVGIFKTPNSEFDKTYIYISLENAQSMLEIPGKVHEFAVITNNYMTANTVRDEIKKELGDKYEVLSYEDLLPFVILQLDMYKESMFILNLIIGLALIFGIINSTLMSVFERINEIGVLMSIGMKNVKIFNMIVLESLIIGLMGTIIGIVSSYLIHIPLGKYGIDLSIFADSLESFGMGAVLYPSLSLDNFIITLLMIPFIAILGAIYPAIKAVRLQPVYALRYV
jgi:ABC-type lipoprotein release transport system permease subunit